MKMYDGQKTVLRFPCKLRHQYDRHAAMTVGITSVQPPINFSLQSFLLANGEKHSGKSTKRFPR